jgi:hypothetical protein
MPVVPFRATRIRLAAACLVALPGAILPGRAAAGDFDGSRPLICASLDLFSCTSADGCEKETPDSLNAPQFLNIDFGQKVINAPRPDGETRTTAIDAVRQLDDRIVLNGAEGELSWTLAIAQATGKMVLNAAKTDPTEPLGITIFGACTVR